MAVFSGGRSRYAAGQIEQTTEDDNKKKKSNEENINVIIDKFLENNKGNEDPNSRYICGKLLRIKYWNNLLKRMDRRLSNHPRVRYVADEIENMIWRESNNLTEEKVLVFGTFKKPLHALNEVLNDRAILRLLDRKKGSSSNPPIP